MANIGASLSGKLSHYWDMETVIDSPYHYEGNLILDRIGSANMYGTAGTTSSVTQLGSGVFGSGITDGALAPANSAQVTASMYNRVSYGQTLTTTSIFGPGSGSFSKVWWQYQTGTITGNCYMPCMAGTLYSTAATTDTTYSILRKTDNTYDVKVYNNSVSTAQTATSTAVTIPLSGWVQYAITFDKIAGDVEFYVNGSGQNLFTADATVQDLRFGGSGGGYANIDHWGFNPCYFNASSAGYTASQFVKAPGFILDEVAIFNEPLTSGEISTLYANGSGQFLPAASTYTEENLYNDLTASISHYYDFAGSGVSVSGILQDKVGSADLTLTSHSGSTTGGFSFADTTSASNDSVMPSGYSSGSQSSDWYFERQCWASGTGSDGVTAFNGDTDFTVSFWRYGTTTTAKAIMSLSNETRSEADNDADGFMIMGLDTEEARLQYQTMNGTKYTGASTDGIGTTAWQHVMMSYHRNTGTWTPYIDGVVAQNPGRAETLIGMGYPGLQPNDNYFFRLFSGSGHATYTPGSALNEGIHTQDVYIDEISIYDTALDYRHASGLYAAGSGYFYPFPAPPIDYSFPAGLTPKLMHYWDMQNHASGLYGGERIGDRVGSIDFIVGRQNNLNGSASRVTNYNQIAAQVSGCWPGGTTFEQLAVSDSSDTDVLIYERPNLSMNAIIASEQENDIATNIGSGVTGDFSCNAWVHYAGPSGSNNKYRIIGGNGTTNTFIPWRLSISESGTLIADIRGSSNTEIESTGIVPSGQWSMCSLTVDSSAGDADLYINGSGNGSVSGDNNVTGHAMSSYGNWSSDSNVFGLLGTVQTNSGPDSLDCVAQLPSGRIDEVSYYSGYLGSSDILDLYNSGNGSFYRPAGDTQVQDEGATEASGSMAHYYSFDQGSTFIADGAILEDKIGDSHLTLKSTPNTTPLDGSTGMDLVDGSGFKHYGVSGSQIGTRHFQRVIKELGSDTVDASLNMFGSGDLTSPFAVSFWRKHDGSVKNADPVVSIGWSGIDPGSNLVVSGVLFSTTYSSSSYMSYSQGVSGTVVAATVSKAEVGIQNSPTLGVGTKSGWIHHVVSVDPSIGAYACFENGFIADAGVDFKIADILNTSSASYSGFACELTVGARSDYTNGQVWWDSNEKFADEIVLHSGWVSSTQATALYNGGSGVTPVYVASGSKTASLGGYVYANGISSGSASGDIGGYVYANGVSNGSSSGNIGGYVYASGEAVSTGTISQARPAATIWEWDTTKVDPTGYRHIESGLYKPAAKTQVIGGFSAQNEASGVLSLLSQADLSPSSDVTGGTKCVTVSVSDPNGLYFDTATESIAEDRGIYNAMMWMNDTSALSASGISPTVHYRKQSTWEKDIALASGTSGVAPFPTNLGSAISLGDINSRMTDSEISNYVYMFVELPSGTYGPGTVGGSSGGFSVRVTYDFSGEGATS